MQRTKSLAIAASVFLLSLSFVPNCLAECGGLTAKLIRPSSFGFNGGHARLVRAALGGGGSDLDGDGAPIVGFWHVKFVSDGITSGIPGGIPKGAEVDAGYSQWHSDGTEIMNSGGRAPDTGDFCLGVWQKVGASTYLLNHFAASWDPSKGANGLVGPANIREHVTLAADGQSFWGTFTINQYSETGVKLAHLQGTITGTRITVNTAPSSIF